MNEKPKAANKTFSYTKTFRCKVFFFHRCAKFSCLIVFNIRQKRIKMKLVRREKHSFVCRRSLFARAKWLGVGVQTVFIYQFIIHMNRHRVGHNYFCIRAHYHQYDNECWKIDSKFINVVIEYVWVCGAACVRCQSVSCHFDEKNCWISVHQNGYGWMAVEYFQILSSCKCLRPHSICATSTRSESIEFGIDVADAAYWIH